MLHSYKNDRLEIGRPQVRDRSFEKEVTLLPSTFTSWLRLGEEILDRIPTEREITRPSLIGHLNAESIPKELVYFEQILFDVGEDVEGAD
jgi:hypothetical protein